MKCFLCILCVWNHFYNQRFNERIFRNKQIDRHQNKVHAILCHAMHLHENTERKRNETKKETFVAIEYLNYAKS